MITKAERVRFSWWLLFLISVWLVSCNDEKSINATLNQNRVSWYLFDPGSATGVRPLLSFEQPLTVHWLPRPRAILATDLQSAPGTGGAVAVAGLGLLLLNDAAGTLEIQRPLAEPPLTKYRTGRLFQWDNKLFITVFQEPSLPLVTPAVSLAWWAPGNSRLAYYPVPSQGQNPLRQAVEVDVRGLAQATAFVDFTWKEQIAEGWAFSRTRLALGQGLESSLPEAQMADAILPLPAEYQALEQRLKARLGTPLESFPARQAAYPGERHYLLVTAEGWVASGRANSGATRLYRLPALAEAGRYTAALALEHGYVLTWETAFRGFCGGAGLVYVPYAVVAP